LRAEIQLDETLLALAHPARRAIMQRLSRGEVRVTTLAKPFAMSLNAVSKHVRMLERARLVRRRRAGREHFLSVNLEPLDEAASWLSAQRAIWTRRLDTLEAILRTEDRLSAKTRRRRRSPRWAMGRKSQPTSGENRTTNMGTLGSPKRSASNACFPAPSNGFGLI
jgi:DNA-binding transcriptional ArsR family regulator